MNLVVFMILVILNILQIISESLIESLQKYLMVINGHFMQEIGKDGLNPIRWLIILCMQHGTVVRNLCLEIYKVI